MKKTLSRVCAFVSFPLGIAGGIWLFTLMNKYFNTETNAFKAPSSNITAISVFIGIACALSIAAGIFAAKNESVPAENPKALSFAAASLFGASGVFSVVALFGGKFGSMGVVYKIFTVAAIVFAFASAAYLLSSAIGVNWGKYLSLALPIWAVLMISSSYFNTSYTYISYPRTVLALALSAMTLFSLECVRRHLGKYSAWLKGLSSGLSVFLGLTYFISRLLTVITRGVSPAISDCLELSLLGMITFIAGANIILPSKEECEKAD